MTQVVRALAAWTRNHAGWVLGAIGAVLVSFLVVAVVALTTASRSDGPTPTPTIDVTPRAPLLRNDSRLRQIKHQAKEDGSSDQEQTCVDALVEPIQGADSLASKIRRYEDGKDSALSERPLVLREVVLDTLSTGDYEVALRLQNLAADRVQFVVPKGQLFEPQATGDLDNRVQGLAIRDEYTPSIGPMETEWFTFLAYCVDEGWPEPFNARGEASGLKLSDTSYTSQDELYDWYGRTLAECMAAD